MSDLNELANAARARGGESGPPQRLDYAHVRASWSGRDPLGWSAWNWLRAGFCVGVGWCLASLLFTVLGWLLAIAGIAAALRSASTPQQAPPAKVFPF